MKIKSIIGIILLALVLAMPSVQSMAQDTVKLTKREQRKLDRQRKKEEKEKKAMEERLKYARMLENRRFVVKANRLFGPRGESYSVSPGINFLAVVDDQVIFQFGFENVVGWNGVGGVTMEGYLENYKFDPGKNKKDALTAQSQVRPKNGGGRAYFNVTVLDNGSAQFDLTLTNGVRLRMSGYLVTPEDAKVFKGQTLF